MEVFLIRALQLILCFSILILLHEGGHFFFAKLFGVRVEKFCLFFDPWKTFKLFRFKGTDYHIGWLPLGGYVTIAGMIDESTKAKELGETIQPWEFRSKPAWQRLLIMVGGVLMNFLVALFIYAMILFSWGETYTPVKEISHGFKFNQTAQQLGFRDGDIPLRTNDTAFEKYNAGNMLRSISQATSVTVLRQGKEVTLNLPGDLSMLEMIKQQPPFMNVLQPSFVDSVGVGTPAQRAGVRAGDRIVAFNGTPISTWNEFMDLRGRMDDVLAAGVPADSQRLRDITLCVQHAGSTSIDTLAFRLDANFQMGTFWHNPLLSYKTVTRQYGFGESFPAGARHGWEVLSGYVSDLRYLFTADGARSVGSFGAIGSLFPTSWDWMRFWELTAFISLMLAFMNILPIPALDGGHVFFLLYEVITRRKPSDRFMEYAQTIGMWLLFILMAYAIFNDFWNFLIKDWF